MKSLISVLPLITAITPTIISIFLPEVSRLVCSASSATACRSSLAIRRASFICSCYACSSSCVSCSSVCGNASEIAINATIGNRKRSLNIRFISLYRNMSGKPKTGFYNLPRKNSVALSRSVHADNIIPAPNLPVLPCWCRSEKNRCALQ